MLTETLLAMLLLQSPQVPECCFKPDWLPPRWPMLQLALVGVALDWELLDPREIPYVLNQRETFAVDLQMLRQRYRELADAPLVHDAFLFPKGDALQQAINFNRTCARWFDEYCAHAPELPAERIAYRRQLDELYRIWDTVREVQCEYYMVTVRRMCLKQLRDMLGEEAYRNGELPPPVPFHLMPWR
ncbi:MAG: hypothetical protein NZM42_06850 [Gemmatales bacterium]|nr:hypothetical protein [Gemmatales bacterium]MDW8223480.1 hypothetical protein [Gemmatales bacterium]